MAVACAMACLILGSVTLGKSSVRSHVTLVAKICCLFYDRLRLGYFEFCPLFFVLALEELMVLFLE